MKKKLAGIIMMGIFSVFVFSSFGHTTVLQLAEPVDRLGVVQEPLFVSKEILERLIMIPDQSDDCASANKIELKFLKAENGIIVFQGTIVGKIEQVGDVDWFEFENSWSFGIINVSTTGGTDTYGELYPDCQSTATFSDDDSGEGDNFSIYAGMAGTGTWKVEVSHSDFKTGTYTLIITIAVPYS